MPAMHDVSRSVSGVWPRARAAIGTPSSQSFAAGAPSPLLQEMTMYEARLLAMLIAKPENALTEIETGTLTELLMRQTHIDRGRRSRLP